MSPVKVGSTFAVTRWKATVVLLSLGIALISAQPGQAQESQGPLTFFKNYFITGDYVVAGVGLRGQGVPDPVTGQMLATGTIRIGQKLVNQEWVVDPDNDVPANADIVAAFLYWQVVTTETDGPDSGSLLATFKGYPLSSSAGPFGKLLSIEGTSPCWASGGGTGQSGGSKKTYTYRADVLRYFAVDETTGKLAVNGAHLVAIPDSGSGGNGTPLALGASLVVVYRDPNPLTPLNAIVLYDGGYTLNNATPTMSQVIRGFYQAAVGAEGLAHGTLTHIVGSGQANKAETVLFNDVQVPGSSFSASAGPSWDNPTFDVKFDPSLTQVTTGVNPSSDCLTWGAVIFKTEVRDTDNDGLVDIWESSDTPILDPNGQALPNLKAMGAAVGPKDLFIEIGYMKTDAPTSYGGAVKPAHSHLPSHAALKLMGDAFANAPTPIKVHFDVGDAYPEGDPIDPAKNAEEYIVRGTGARGGEAIDESDTVCTPDPAEPWVCQFSAYPGTVGWKTGFKFLRDQVLSGDPAPLPGEDDPCDLPGNTCVRRFDRNRKDIFRYVLFAHALGLPKSEEPLHPDFHVPRTSTGVGDFPGGDVMVTLGAFNDHAGLPVGTPFMQASTLMHELGHNLERRHGGEALEPNCKPTYLSVMNYLYQLRGLLDDGGKPHLDFSRSITSPAFDELNLFDGGTLSGWPEDPLGLGRFRYRIGWYAPLAGSYLVGRGTAALKHCDGSILEPTDVPMVRIDARTAASPIDWKANGIPDPVGPEGPPPSVFSLDINFNGDLDASLVGSNDWANIRLNQIGGRRNTGGLFVVDVDAVTGVSRLYVGPLSLDSGRGDLGRGDLGRGDLGGELGRGDLGRGDLGRGDLGRGDLGRGDLGRGDLGRGDLGRGDLGRGDLGRGDLGGGDLFGGDPERPGGELDAELARDLAKTPPNEFKACVIVPGGCTAATGSLHDVRTDFKAPNVGGVSEYIVYRVAGASLVPGLNWVEVGRTPAVPGQIDYTVVDSALPETLDGKPYTYFAVAVYREIEGGVPRTINSDASNLVTINPAVNDTPTISDIANLEIFADSSTGPLSFSVGDERLFRVTVTGASDNEGLVPPANIKFEGSGASRTVTVTPVPSQTGTATITVTVTDGADYKASDSFVLTVKPRIYTFNGFLSPLKIAGSETVPSDSGAFMLGKAIPIKWKLTLGATLVNDLSSLKMLSAVPGTALNNPACTPLASAPTLYLLDPATGRPTGNSTYRFDTTNNQFVFNWDTSAASKSYCYRLTLTLKDNTAARVTIVRFK